MKTRTFIAAALSAALVTTGAALAAPGGKDRGKGHKGGKQPVRYELPDGYQPEGIASGRGHRLFVGSIPTGEVLRLNARTGETTTAVPPQDGRAAIGLEADRQERLFVAGGPTGDAYVYDASDGESLAAFELAPEGAPTFVNDVTLTRDTAWFTDSQRAVLYAVDRDLSGFEELAVDVPLVAGFNLNGIEDTPGGRWLLAVQSATGVLWRIDPETGDATAVDLGGYALTAGDGLLRKGRRLYVVQNRINTVAVLKLGKGWTSGRLLRTITSEQFDVPTTVARKGKNLFLPNARFGTADPESAEYWVTRVRR